MRPWFETRALPAPHHEDSGWRHFRIRRFASLVLASSRVSKQAGRFDQQHDGGDEIEDRQLDFRKKLNSCGSHEADDESTNERALQAAEPADDHDDESKDQRVDAHAEHGGLARNNDGAA